MLKVNEINSICTKFMKNNLYRINNVVIQNFIVLKTRDRKGKYLSKVTDDYKTNAKNLKAYTFNQTKYLQLLFGMCLFMFPLVGTLMCIKRTN